MAIWVVSISRRVPVRTEEEKKVLQKRSIVDFSVYGEARYKLEKKGRLAKGYASTAPRQDRKTRRVACAHVFHPYPFNSILKFSVLVASVLPITDKG